MPDLRICPSPHRYAVIRMDPVASVQHLNDPKALEAAKAMTTKSYLVWLGTVCVFSGIGAMCGVDHINYPDIGFSAASTRHAVVRFHRLSHRSVPSGSGH